MSNELMPLYYAIVKQFMDGREYCADDVIESPNSIVIPEAANREISCSVVIKRMLQAL